MTEKNILKYLEKHIDNFKVNKRGKVWLFTCPVCKKEGVCRFIPFANKVNCVACSYTGDIVDIAKVIGDIDFEDTDDIIRDKLCIDLGLKNERIQRSVLDFYSNCAFDMTPIKADSKLPFELDWLNKEHKDITEWEEWLALGMNIGVKCGKKSNITIIDIDQTEIPADIDLVKGNPLIQKTGRGWHFIYKYADLPTTKITEYKLDILNNGKQAVIYPSTITDEAGNKSERQFITPLELTEMPPDLIKLLKSKLDSHFSQTVANNEIKDDIIIDENSSLNLIDSGSRNNALLQLGGILSKELNSQQVEFAISVLNKKLCTPPLGQKEVMTIAKSLDKYLKRDEKDLATQIFKYLNIVEFANSKEIRDALGFPKEDIDKALAYLVKELRLLKRGRNFSIIKRANWKTDLNVHYNNIDFNMPYFGQHANLCWGDMIVLGSKSKYGKTTIAINLVADLVKQGKKPYYISLEAGSRFTKTAMALKLQEGDFVWDFVPDPTKIQLEDNAITILDWLLVEDKSQTDNVMKHFVEQLYKTQGFLIAFVQLKEDGSYFAPNMTKQFPALAARYLYTDDDAGIKGNWVIDAIRDPKKHTKTGIIPCEYDIHTKMLKEVIQ